VIGVISWLAVVWSGRFFRKPVYFPRGDKGLFALTLRRCTGGLSGGLCGQIAAIGNGTTFTFYGLIFASVGAALALFTYRRLIGV